MKGCEAGSDSLCKDIFPISHNPHIVWGTGYQKLTAFFLHYTVFAVIVIYILFFLF
jgi:hypothetical protein